MIFKFSYDMHILGVPIAYDIEGNADIDVDADGEWTVEAIWLDSAAFGDARSVILPEDHPLCREIKLWLLRSKRDAIDEAVGETIPRNDPNREHRHSKRELV